MIYELFDKKMSSVEINLIEREREREREREIIKVYFVLYSKGAGLS